MIRLRASNNLSYHREKGAFWFDLNQRPEPQDIRGNIKGRIDGDGKLRIDFKKGMW